MNREGIGGLRGPSSGSEVAGAGSEKPSAVLTVQQAVNTGIPISIVVIVMDDTRSPVLERNSHPVGACVTTNSGANNKPHNVELTPRRG
jgi:hypothetical protein